MVNMSMDYSSYSIDKSVGNLLEHIEVVYKEQVCLESKALPPE